MTGYTKHGKTYPASGEITIRRDVETGLYTIPSMGISAAALSVDGFPVALSAGCEMNCSPRNIDHVPKAFRSGLLRVNSPS